LSIASLLKITNAMALKAVLVVDEDLLAQMRPQWEKRDGSKAYARRRASLGVTTMKRVLSPVASEMGKRGHAAMMKRTTPELRRELAKAAAETRWQHRRPDR
jgi:hypothetical protein